MSPNRLPPPPRGCLYRPYSSNTKCKGGTVIVEDVTDRETHERWQCDPDGYRLPACLHCQHKKLHRHGFRERKVCRIVLVRYLCPACKATWYMMPLFVARMLWREWSVVESETIGPPPPDGSPRVPTRTVRRWRARLRTAAVALAGSIVDALKPAEGTHALRTPEEPATDRCRTDPPPGIGTTLKGILRERGEVALATMATAIGKAVTRLDLIVAFAEATAARIGERLSRLAATIHCLVPGVRLM